MLLLGHQQFLNSKITRTDLTIGGAFNLVEIEEDPKGDEEPSGVESGECD